MWRDFSKTLRELLEIPGYGGAYRPDLHYMRGPGPKWHAKYGAKYDASAPKIASNISPPAKPSAPAIRDIAEHRA
jgi:hypothetical protein